MNGNTIMTIKEIYEEYFDGIYEYVERMTGKNIICDDIVNETFLRAMINIDKVNQCYSIEAWLKRVAKNYYLNRLRELKYISLIDNNIDEMPELVDNSDLTCRIITQENVVRARFILYNLPEIYREVYMWRVVVGLNYAEIGRIFGITESWARRTYLKARKIILAEMKNN